MDPLIAPARSWLFVPANRPERFAKAAASGADRVIVDLEDAVAPADKRSACASLSRVVLPDNAHVYLRVNAASTEWFDENIDVAAKLPLAGVLLPKAESAADVARAASRLPNELPIVPIVETAVGVWNVLDVARAKRVERLVFGALDFELDTGMLEGDDTFAYARSRIAIASRVAGLAPPIDSVTIAIDDDARLSRDAERSRRFGFAGKLCIHPRQVATLNRLFRPSDDELAWAGAVLDELARRPGVGVFAFHGTMVDRPVIERARRIQAHEAQIHDAASAPPRDSDDAPPNAHAADYDPAAERAALDWLALADRGDMDRSWNATASWFRDVVTRPQWAQSFTAARSALGAVVRRSIRSVKSATVLPGAPDGEYVVFEFDTSFEHKRSAKETVTPMRDTDGQWRVSGYFVR
jgi:citrate lyase subunit beta/citryl-CoA lyase